MMRCPDRAQLRAALDGEAPPEVTAHTDTCARCRERSATLAADAAHAATAVALLAPPEAETAGAETAGAETAGAETAGAETAGAETAGAETAGAETAEVQDATVTALGDAREDDPVTRRDRGPALRRVAAVAAAVVVVAGTLSTPAGRTAAADFLSSFRSERFEVVTIDPAALEGTAAAFATLGDVTTSGGEEPREVADVAAASEAAGIPLSAPPAEALPASLVGIEPTIGVTGPSELRVTFDAERIADHLATFDGPVPTVPDGLDGAALVVRVAPAALLAYETTDDVPSLLVGATRPVEIDVEGDVTLDIVRAFLLDLPGLPPETVRQLEAIDDWRTTLPVPVPAELAGAAREADVAGTSGIVVEVPPLGEGAPHGAAALWQRDGVVHGVAAPTSLEEVMRVADSLR